MPSFADPRCRRHGGPLRLLRLLVLLLGVFLAAMPGAAAETGDLASDLDIMVDRANEIIKNELTTTAEIEAIRAQLATQRDKVVAEQHSYAPAITEINARITALGPVPAEGATEAPEVAALREQLNEELAQAQAPAAVAAESAQRASATIDSIDRLVRSRFSAELVARAPMPLLPKNWMVAAEELGHRFADLRRRVLEAISQPEVSASLYRRLPLHLAIALSGIVLAVVVRRRIGDWIDRRFAKGGGGQRMTAWFIALRNLNRLLLPVVGAILVIAALDPVALTRGDIEGRLLRLPGAVALLIVSSWLATSLFSPGAPEHRPLPLDDRDAREGAVLTVVSGVLLAATALLRNLIAVWDLSTTTQAVLGLLLIIVGTPVVWRFARLLSVLSTRIPGQGPQADGGDGGDALILPMLVQASSRGLRLIALAIPVLGALGFVPAAAFFGIGALLSLALAGLAIVIFLLLNTAFLALLRPEPGNGGLIPVVIGLLVLLACIPVAALIWGARPSDIRDTWALLRDGVTLGGVRISINVVVVFVAVFLLILTLTRLLQTALRSTVLPRTRLDTGARDAVLAGVGYVGFAMAGISGVSAAGVNLASLAIVAGALSVGIGFGLQAVVSNFVSGIILLVERPIKQGDWIEVGAQSGYVRGIRVRSTEIETFDRASLIVPNSQLISGVVLNRTHMGMSGRLIVPISVAYDTDPRVVERILLDIADAHPLVLDAPPPAVLFMNVASDQLDFELRCRLRDVNFMLSVRSDLNFTIVERFRAEGIEFPLPARSRAAQIVAEQSVVRPDASAEIPAPKPPHAMVGDGGAKTDGQA